MPWVGREEYDELQLDIANFRVEIATLQAKLDAETSRRERLELEHARLNDDFRGLIALTAGRIPPKVSPEFDRDPYAEDTTQAVTFLSPDPDADVVDPEEILRALRDARSEESPLSG